MLPNWVQGNRHTGLRLRWRRRDGTYPDLTGATITGKIKNVASSAAATALTGTLAPDTTAASSGYFTYAPSVADVGTAGRFMVQFTATYSDSKPDLTFQAGWTIEEAL